MDVRSAARRWAATWEAAWERLDAEAIIGLYRPDAGYVSAPFRDPDRGPAPYLSRVLPEEAHVEARFDEPIVDGDRAAVRWWATLIENGEPITLAGTSVLRFDANGLVVEQWDAWDQADGRRPPPVDWGRPRADRGSSATG